MNVRFAIVLVLLPASLVAQAAAEAAAGAARAATTAVPAQKAGKAIGGVFDNLNRALKDFGKATPAVSRAHATLTTSTPTPAEAKAASAANRPLPKPDVTFEDPSAIQEGMDYVEVTKRFGPPSLKLTAGPNQETLCYARKGVNIDVTVRDDKVTSVKMSGGPDPSTAIR